MAGLLGVGGGIIMVPVGDEGGFAPMINDNESDVNLVKSFKTVIVKAINL